MSAYFAVALILWLLFILCVLNSLDKRIRALEHPVGPEVAPSAKPKTASGR